MCEIISWKTYKLQVLTKIRRLRQNASAFLILNQSQES